MDQPKKRRGFAAMSREKAAEISRLGGKAAHASGHARKWDSESGRAARQKRVSRPSRPTS